MDLNNKPEFTRGGRGLYCSNIQKILEEVGAKGLADQDIAKIAGIALSTVTKWRRDKAADKRYTLRFLTRLKAIETPEVIGQSTQKGEQVAEIEHFFETAKRIGIDNFTISPQSLKEILLKGLKL